ESRARVSRSRQRVQVLAAVDHGTGPTPSKYTDDTRVGHAGPNFVERYRLEVLGDEGRRLVLPIPELGIPVDAVSKLDGLVSVPIHERDEIDVLCESGPCRGRKCECREDQKDGEGTGSKHDDACKAEMVRLQRSVGLEINGIMRRK